MRERPILFSGPMVRAILDGRKTQTRRVVKHSDLTGDHVLDCMVNSPSLGLCAAFLPRAGARQGFVIKSPYGQPGDLLWVRETWQDVHPIQVSDGRYTQPGRAGIPGPPAVKYQTIYRADGEYPPTYCLGGEPWPFRSLQPFERGGIEAFEETPRWVPSIHMPRWASRLTLRITDVRVERLQEISADDCRAEGHPMDPARSSSAEVHDDAALDWYRDLWDSLNAARGYGWDANPWVWVVEFERLDCADDCPPGHCACHDGGYARTVMLNGGRRYGKTAARGVPETDCGNPEVPRHTADAAREEG